MRNIFHIFASEVKLIGTNIITAMIILGLVIMPSLFTWYNVLACWNVFNNMDNLTVAVANSDEGFESDLLPMKVNVGETVVSSLRANTQIRWVFVDEDEAIDGTASGKYYAAVVIPENFSESMLTFYQPDAQTTDLTYYSNVKINAISPQLLGQGASLVSYQVNEAFAESVNAIALSLVESASNYLDSEEGLQKLAELSASLRSIANRADHTAGVLGTYSQLMSSARQLLLTSSDSAYSLESALDDGTAYFKESSKTASEISTTLTESLDAMDAAIDNSMDAIQKIIDKSYSAEGISGAQIATNLRTQKATVDNQIVEYNKVLAELQKDPEENAEAIASLQKAITALEDLSSTLDDAAQDAESMGTIGGEDWIKIKAQIALDALRAVKGAFNETFRASLDSFSSEVASLSGSVNSLLNAANGKFDAIGNELETSANSTVAAQSKLESVTTDISNMAADLRETCDGLDEALDSGSVDVVRAFLNSGVDTLSNALAAPVSVERTAINSSENFGSSMYPFYAALSLFIGALLCMVLVKPRVAQRVLDEFPQDKLPSSRQRFLGHFGVVSVISLAQSFVLGIGSLFFLGVQAQHPFYFMLALMVSGLVMAFIMYMLVTSFANLGKAAGVLLLIVQVTACGGSYPLVVLPQFVQDISVWVPAYHIVNALRAAMFGVYANDFWIELGLVALFAIPVLILAMVLNKPFAAFSKWYMKKAAETKLLS